MEQQEDSSIPIPNATPLAQQSADLAAVQAALQARVQQLQQLVPAAALVDSESKIELLEQLQEALASAQALVYAVAAQQRLTGRDPLTPAAIAAALARAPWSFDEEEEDQTTLRFASKGAAAQTAAAASDDSDSESEDQGGAAEAYGELSAAGRQQLLAVLGVADALDRSQLIGLAHLAKCSPHHVRSLFSELRTRLRNHAAAASKRASKAAAAEAAGAAEAAAAEADNRKQQPEWMTSHPGYYQPPLFLQHDAGVLQGTGGAGSSSHQAAGSAAAGAADPAVGPTCARLAATISGQRERLAKVLDQETGAIVSGGRFLGLLGSLTTWAARSTALKALAASYSDTSNSGASRPSSGAASRSGAAAASGASAAVRGQLASSRLLDVLEGWLQQAKRENQVTLMRQMLQVLPSISLSSALLQSSPLSTAVADLHAHPNAALAAAARHVSHAWALATGQAAPAGIGSKQHSGSGGLHAAVLGGLIQCGGSGDKAFSAGHKRRVTLAVKRHLEDMQLVGDLKRHNTAAAAAAAVRTAAAGAAAEGAAGAASGAAGQVGSAVTGTADAAAGKPPVVSSGLKKPSRRGALQPGAGAAAGAAAGGGSQPRQGQTKSAQASRRLAALHALNGKGVGGQGQQLKQQQQSVEQAWAALTQQQRLHAMSQHGRAPASFLAAAGPLAAEVTQAVQAYDQAVQCWQRQRCTVAAQEQQAAEAAQAALAGQPCGASDAWLWQASTGAAAAAGDAGGGGDVAVWVQPPPAVSAAALAGVAAGEASQLAPKDDGSWRERYRAAAQQRQQQGGEEEAAAADPLEPSEAAAAAAAAAAASSAAPAVVSLVAVAEDESAKERVNLWLAGIRLPCHIRRPPTSAEISRERQRQQQEALQAEYGHQQQLHVMPAGHELQYQQQYQQQYRAAPQAQQPPQYYQQHQPVVAVLQQQQPQVVQYHLPPHQQAAMQPLQQQQQQPYLQAQQQYQQHPQYKQPVQQQHIQVLAMDPLTQQPQLQLLPVQHHVMMQQAPVQLPQQLVYAPQQHEQLMMHQLPPGYAPGGYQQQAPQPIARLQAPAAQQQQQQVVYVVGPAGLAQQVAPLPLPQQPEPHQQGYFPQGY